MNSFFVKALRHQDLRIKCSVKDHLSFRVPVPVVFFYSTFVEVAAFTRLLEHVLSDFPIFAGILVKEDNHLYIRCNNQGVLVQRVQSTESFFKTLARFPALPSATFVEMISPFKNLKQGGPVLTIKITHYSDGTAIGYCWHHSIGDMSTFMQFLKAMSAFALGKSYDSPLIPQDRESYFQKWEGEKPLYRQDPFAGFKLLTLKDVFFFAKALCSRKKYVFIHFSKEEVENLRNSISHQAGKKLTRMEAVCAHLLTLIAQCRTDKKTMHYASTIVDFRKRTGNPSYVLGNCVDMVTIKMPQPCSAVEIANAFHLGVNNYACYQSEPLDFISQNGGMKKIGRVLPKELLPEHKNLVFSSWTNFGVYSIDLGFGPPKVFLPMGEMSIPWMACVFEGFDNEGLIMGLALPYLEGKRLTEPTMVEKIHQYRKDLSIEKVAILKQNPWCI